MLKKCRIQRTSEKNQEKLRNVPPLLVDCYPWDEKGYRPRTEVQCLYDDQHLYVRFKAYESGVKVTHFELNSPVYKDSCVEFFFNPNPQGDQRYLNFEINPLGVFLLAIGKDRYERQYIDDVTIETFQISSSITRENLESCSQEFWSIDMAIPFSFIEKHYGKLEFKKGMKMKGNFYKCGDETPYPHYGCWSPIGTDAPDFHRPEYFGELILD